MWFKLCCIALMVAIATAKDEFRGDDLRKREKRAVRNFGLCNRVQTYGPSPIRNCIKAKRMDLVKVKCQFTFKSPISGSVTVVCERKPKVGWSCPISSNVAILKCCDIFCDL
ncbi:uncharacterized protein [Clytia hemisphaerica]|uniref:Cnidarian restricted protein n=1 Tax=Clytia hemisphaerica TaxID=252671 RepID=A0A7M5U6X9_9CNID